MDRLSREIKKTKKVVRKVEWENKLRSNEQLEREKKVSKWRESREEIK